MRSHLPAFQARLRSSRTAKTYGKIVSDFVAYTDDASPATISRAAVEGFLWRPRASNRKPSVSTYNQELSALRVFSKFLVAAGELALPVKDIEFERGPASDPAFMTEGEVRRCFEEAAKEDHKVRRARALALVGILTQLGLRVEECVKLDVDQVDFTSATLLAIRGKGGTVHDLPVNKETLTLISEWLKLRPTVAHVEENALFVSRLGKRLSVRTVQRLFVSLRAKIGTSKKVTPHTARHSTATIALAQGAHIVTVSQILRHASVNTTMKYIHLLDGDRRSAIGRLGVLVPSELRADDEAPPVELPKNVPGGDAPVDVHISMDDVDGLDRAA